MRKSLPLFFVGFFIVFGCKLNAQKLHYELPENASKLYNSGNYVKALELYRSLHKKNMKDVKNTYYFGVCLINTHEYDDGIKTLEKIASKSNCPDEVWFHLAKGYHYTLRFDKAIAYFKKFISLTKDEKLINESNRLIEMCLNAKSLVKNPVNVNFENVGDRINSKGKDYLPFITDNESLLHFTTRREGTTGRIYDMEGYYTSDIYTAKYKYEKWSKTRSVGYPNSYGNEFTAGVSEDGEKIFYYLNNPDNKNVLHISRKSKSSFKKSEEFKSKSINSKNSEQISATITNDENTLIFSSNRTGAVGGFDLYTCKKLPNGKWGEPTSLSPNINSIANENYPYLTDNGNTLYFASDGYNSMGGYDIFKSIYDDEKNEWSSPINIGYPINTPLDDYSICFTNDKKFAYVAAIRNDSYGDYDIYKINFEEKPSQLTTIKGYVLDADSNIINTPVHIEVFNAKTGDLQGIYDSNQKGTYFMILAPGQYNLVAEIPDQGTFKEKLTIKDRKLFKPEISRNIRVNFAQEIEQSQ
jgi:tetratricopeptide (TPR) repeat protein